MLDWEKVMGCPPDAFSDAYCTNQPKWVTGSLSHYDTRFLFKTTLSAGTSMVVEIGTASGFSTGVLCHALNFANQAGMISSNFHVISYDISPYFYDDQSKRVGDAAREQLPPELMKHITFRHPASALDVAQYHGNSEIKFLFIDANHNHPWPTLDFLAILDSVSPGSVVVLHDINLPIIHPEFPAWGVKYLFDELHVRKDSAQDGEIPNIGSITIPEDKERIRPQLLEILFAHEWQADPRDYRRDYLDQLGIEIGAHRPTSTGGVSRADTKSAEATINMADQVSPPTKPSTYQELILRLQNLVRLSLPAEATVIVASKGDDELLKLDGRRAWHFPQREDGKYAGYYPADSSAAIAQLESLRAKGAEFLIFPQTAFWWFEYYDEFRQHLERKYRIVAYEENTCVIFELREMEELEGQKEYRDNRSVLEPLMRQIRRDAIAAGRRKYSPPAFAPIGEPASLWKETRSYAPSPTPNGRSKPRVLYVCHNHPTIIPGGAEVYALELYEAMRRSGEFEPIFLARVEANGLARAAGNGGAPFGPVNDDSNQHLFYTKRSDFDLFYMTSRHEDLYSKPFQDFLLAYKPDVVHFQHTLFLGYDLVSRTRNTLPDAAIVYTLQEFLPICHRDGQMVRARDNELCREPSPQNCNQCFPEIPVDAFVTRKHFIQSQLGCVDLFLAPSRFLLERYVEWGIPREKIRYEEYGRVIDNCMDVPPVERPRNRFGFFGQINPFKGVDVLLKAMREVDDAHLWLYGANLELQRGAFQDEIRSLLAEMQHKVTFAGRYDHADLPRLMANVDWVIVPSIWWENSPLVIQEAFAHGRPVICSDIGGMAEKVTHDVNGLHFRVGDPVSLAQTIFRAVSSTGLWHKLRGGIPEVYKMDEHVATVTGIYHQLLGPNISVRNNAHCVAEGA